MHKVVPLPNVSIQCSRGCCQRIFPPLTLAFAKTIHSFQGLGAGPVTPGRPSNPVQRIIVDPGTKSFEMISPSLLYTAFSRATTLGPQNEDKKLNSAVYFTGVNITPNRMINMTKKKDGNMTVTIKRRQKWIQRIENNTITSSLTNRQKESLFQYFKDTKLSESIIYDHIHSN